MKYVALKPCNFGRPFYIGESIPGEVIDPGMTQTLIRRGVIAVRPEEAEKPEEAAEKVEKTEQSKPKKTIDKQRG